MKKKFLNVVLLFFTFFLPGIIASGQESLSLSTALETALKNNFFIRISKNDEQIAKNDNTAGNAGMLPSVNLAAGISTASNSTEQRYSNGNTVKQDGAKTDNVNAGVRLEWTLFDGMQMFAAKSRLQTGADMGSIRLKMEIENTVASVINAYFNVVRLQQKIQALEETIKVYDDRVMIADTRFQIGSASRLEYLQATVDRNEKRSELFARKSDLNDALAEMNRLMGRNDFVAFTATDTIAIQYNPSGDNFFTETVSFNNELQLYDKNIQLYKALSRETRALRYPELTGVLNYTFNRTDNEVGFSLLNQNRGFNAGLTLSWNLFNGFNSGREIRNAKIRLQSSELSKDDFRSKLSNDIFVTTRKFKTDKSLVKLEEENLAFAEENANVAMEAFRLGKISGIQLREARNSYDTAVSRLIDARYQAKVDETLLMKLHGDLVK